MTGQPGGCLQCRARGLRQALGVPPPGLRTLSGPRAAGKTENGVGYVKKNAIAGRSFASWEALEAHLDAWTREVADRRLHGTTGEAPIERIRRDEADRLKPISGMPPFQAARDLSRVVQNDCAVEVDGNAYSVAWRLIGERVRVTVSADTVRVFHGAREVAVHRASAGRRQRVVDAAHLEGLVGRGEQPPRQACPAAPAQALRAPVLLRSLAEYEALVGGGL